MNKEYEQQTFHQRERELRKQTGESMPGLRGRHTQPHMASSWGAGTPPSLHGAGAGLGRFQESVRQEPSQAVMMTGPFIAVTAQSLDQGIKE